MGQVSTNPYTSQSISGYNTSPPPDDGSESSSNKLEWDKHKSKLADPIKTLAEAVNTAVSSAFDKTVNLDAGERSQLSGSLAFEWATATIGTDAIAAEASAMAVGTESGATQDTLQAITATGVYSGAMLTIKQRNATEELNIIHATSTAATATGANIYLGSAEDFLMDSREKLLTLVYDDQVATATGWYETTRPGPVAASQADMESATSSTVMVTPAQVRYHQGICKVWASVDRSAGTPSLDSPSYNVSSVADDGDSNTIVTIGQDFSSAIYSAFAHPMGDASGDVANVHSMAAGAFDVKVSDSAGNGVDTQDFACGAFGDQ